METFSLSLHISKDTLLSSMADMFAKSIQMCFIYRLRSTWVEGSRVSAIKHCLDQKL